MNVALQRVLGSSVVTLVTKPRRVGIALILSLLFPGWGQIYNGQLGKAVAIRGAWLLASGCAIVIGVMATFPRLVALFVAYAVLYVLVAADAILCARRLRAEPGRFTANRWYAYLGLAVVVYGLNVSGALVTRRFLFKAYRVGSSAMEPTLLIGDEIMVDKRATTPHRGDVVVFMFPPDPTKDLVKRVVAVGGDTVQVKTGRLFLEGQEASDPHAHFEIPPQERVSSSERDYFGPIKVPEGKYFVMGDNRDHSYDSRFWGLVDKAEVEGGLLYIYWSRSPQSSARTRVRWQRIGMRVQ
jgi:signal peptidase I